MPDGKDDLKTLRQQEYAVRLEAERLRREVYAQANPMESPELLKELAEAEKVLASVEGKRVAAQKADADSGAIWGTKKKGRLLGADTTGLEAQVLLRMEHVPTAICHLFDPDENPLVSCKVHNHDSKTRRVRVSAEVERYSARAVDTAELAGGTKMDPPFRLMPTFFPERLRAVTELTRATLNVQVEDLDGAVEQHKTVPIWLLARTTMPTAVLDPATGEWRDMSRYLGAFVTPNAPTVQKYLRTAARYHPDGRICGYQKGKADVESQVKAIYDALKDDADITYVNSRIDFNPDQGTRSQRVRLPRESLENKEANCIDGAVLFASLLEGASLSPAIVVVPGHALVAWETGPDTEKWEYLETIMIGTHSFDDAWKSGNDQAEFYEDMRDGTGNPNYFRHWPLRVLRPEFGITPME